MSRTALVPALTMSSFNRPIRSDLPGLVVPSRGPQRYPALTGYVPMTVSAQSAVGGSGDVQSVVLV